MTARLKSFFQEGRGQKIWRVVGYGLVILAGFSAVFNLVVAVIAGIEGEWVIAAGLLFVGGGFVLLSELFLSFFFQDIEDPKSKV